MAIKMEVVEFLKLQGGDIGIIPSVPMTDIVVPPPKGLWERFKRKICGDPRPPRFHFILERPFNTDVLVDMYKIEFPRDGNTDTFNTLTLRYKFVPALDEKALKLIKRAKKVTEEEE